jgi:type II secretory pathway component PulC
MTNPRLKYLLVFLLITLLCAGAVEAFYYVLGNKLAASTPTSTPTSSSTTGTRPQTTKSRPAAGTAQPKQEVDIAVITRRNLFASRTGTPEAKPPTDPLEGVSPSTLAVVLMGTVTGPEGEHRAVIYDKKGRKQELYQVGDFIHQAAIKNILRGKVIITYNGKDEMLDIADARSVKVPKPRPVVAPKTTAQRVIGRPASSPSSRAKAAVPRPRNPSRLQTARNRVIVKSRTTSNKTKTRTPDPANPTSEAP